MVEQTAGFNEWRLVQRYAHEGSQTAFRALVDRYANLVYSTCLRELGDRQVAEDATQATFLVLAKKAPHLKANAPLSSWLFSTARLVSKNARRRKSVHRKMEQAAMDDFVRTQERQPGGDDANWSLISDNLHAAMDRLSANDRETILLRFFEQRSMRETGEILGVSEDAAKKRVSRALERLRSCLTGRHVAVPVVVLAALLTDRAVDAAPPTCLSTLHSMASPAGLPAAGHPAGIYAKGALQTMKTGTYLKVGAAVATVAILTISAGIFASGHTMYNGHLYTSVPTPSGGWILKHQFIPGASLTYHIEQTTNDVTTAASGQSTPAKIDTGLTLSEKFGNVDPSTGNASMHVQLGLDKLLYNGQPTPVPQQFVTMITHPADLEVTPLGGSVNSPNSQGDGNNILQSISSSGCFPDHPVQPGDTWATSMTMFGSNYDVKSTLRNVLQENDQQVVVIEQEISKSAVQPTQPVSADLAHMGFDTATVDETFDVATGCLLNSTTKSTSTFDEAGSHTVAKSTQSMTLAGS